MPVATRVQRRTQEMRRETTIRKLLDAATGALIEVGYAEASVQQVCARARVSHGGLFRHFPTREALMVAVAADVGAKLLEHYRRAFEALAERQEPLELALRLVRTSCRSRQNQAWYELAMAARTNPRLRKALGPLAARYYQDIVALARQLLPDLAAALGPHFDVLVDTIVAVFDGEVVHRFVLKKPAVEEARLELLLLLARQLVGAKERPTARTRS
jgi:AcrR family transcriptional regulator